MSTKLTNENFVPTKFNKKKDKERENSKEGPIAVQKMLTTLRNCKEKARCKEKVKKQLRKLYANKCYKNNKTKNTSACKEAKEKTEKKTETKKGNNGYKFHPVYGNLRY